jgi:hypothetical protein
MIDLEVNGLMRLFFHSGITSPGVPPKSKAETITFVSITTRGINLRLS